MYRNFLLLLCLITLLACGSRRKELERAGRYEQEGMLTEAHAAYEALYERRPKVVEAHVGMERTAQQMLDKRMSQASMRFMANELEQGKQARNEAVILKQQMDRKGLALHWDGSVDDHYRAARTRSAREMLTQANEAFREERFQQAQELSDQVIKLDPELKEAEYLMLLAQLEPRYREGRKAEDLGLWSEAHAAFRWITERDMTYKDALQRQRAAKEKAAFTVAYVPLYNSQLYTAKIGMGAGMVEHQLAASLKQAILDQNDPLLILVDRDNTDALLAEQQRNMTGTYDDRYVAEAGKLLGAAYVLTGRILRFDDVLSRQIEVQMQVIHTESGRIMLADVVRVNKQEIGRGAARAQLLDRAANRMALRLSEMDHSEH